MCVPNVECSNEAIGECYQTGSINKAPEDVIPFGGLCEDCFYNMIEDEDLYSEPLDSEVA